MYFQEFDNLNKALDKAKLVLIPTLKNQLATLYENSNNLGDEEQNQGLFSILTFKLKSDLDSLLRMVDQVLFPLIEQIISGHKSEHKIQSFDILRVHHDRCISNISELRLLCNNYMTNTQWSNSKRKVCLNLYHLEQTLLAYINFMENSI
jgi:iron-sulfur cluster repair protein YtfE (RIC family)